MSLTTQHGSASTFVQQTTTLTYQLPLPNAFQSVPTAIMLTIAPVAVFVLQNAQLILESLVILLVVSIYVSMCVQVVLSEMRLAIGNVRLHVPLHILLRMILKGCVLKNARIKHMAGIWCA